MVSSGATRDLRLSQLGGPVERAGVGRVVFVGLSASRAQFGRESKFPFYRAARQLCKAFPARAPRVRRDRPDARDHRNLSAVLAEIAPPNRRSLYFPLPHNGPLLGLWALAYSA